MPSAPNSFACRASAGVSAFARTSDGEWKSMERKEKPWKTSCVRYETYPMIDLMISLETSKAKIQGKGQRMQLVPYE